jgi:hypothetical protein
MEGVVAPVDVEETDDRSTFSIDRAEDFGRVGEITAGFLMEGSSHVLSRPRKEAAHF